MGQDYAYYFQKYSIICCSNSCAVKNKDCNKYLELEEPISQEDYLKIRELIETHYETGVDYIYQFILNNINNSFKICYNKKD